MTDQDPAVQAQATVVSTLQQQAADGDAAASVAACSSSSNAASDSPPVALWAAASAMAPAAVGTGCADGGARNVTAACSGSGNLGAGSGQHLTPAPIARESAGQGSAAAAAAAAAACLQDNVDDDALKSSDGGDTASDVPALPAAPHESAATASSLPLRVRCISASNSDDSASSQNVSQRGQTSCEIQPLSPRWERVLRRLNQFQALSQAAKRFDAAAVQQQLADGVDPDVRNLEGTTVLMRTACCVDERAEGIIDLLLAAGADVHARDCSQWTALAYAATIGCRPKVVSALLARGADPNPPYFTNLATGEFLHLLAHAVMAHGEVVGNHMQTIALALLAAGADPNARDANGATPLVQAVRQSNMQLVQALLAAGAQPNLPAFQPITKRSPFYVWVLTANELHRDENQPQQVGIDVTPLAAACLFSAAGAARDAIIDSLLQAGADPNARGPLNSTALEHAIRRDKLSMVQALLAAGADPDQTTPSNGETALMMAAVRGNTAIVKALLDAGANARATNAGGKTALQLASCSAVRLLLLKQHSRQRTAAAARAKQRTGQQCHKDPEAEARAAQLAAELMVQEAADRHSANSRAQAKASKAKARKAAPTATQAPTAAAGTAAAGTAAAGAVVVEGASSSVSSQLQHEALTSAEQQHSMVSGCTATLARAVAAPVTAFLHQTEDQAGPLSSLQMLSRQKTCSRSDVVLPAPSASPAPPVLPAPPVPLSSRGENSNRNCFDNSSGSGSGSGSSIAMALSQSGAAPTLSVAQRPAHQDSLGDAGCGDERWCMVCMEQPRSALLVPCGHLVMCSGCCEAVRKTSNECPICRQVIEDELQVCL